MIDELFSFAQTDRQKLLCQAIKNAAWKVYRRYDLHYNDIDDLIQDGLLLMYEIKPTLDKLDDSNAAAYLCASCYNNAIRQLRRNRKINYYESEKINALAIWKRDDEERLKFEKKRDERRAFVFAYVDAMKERKNSRVKEVVYYTLENRTSTQIARVLKTKANNVCSILKNFVKAIRFNLDLCD